VGLSLSLTSWVVSASLGVVKTVPYAVLLLLRILPVVLTAFAFAMLYFALPSRRVMARDALAGGLLAATAFEAMKHGFAVYITQFSAYKLVYGAFSAIPVFLIWVYLSWVVVLFGAAAAAVLPEWRERRAQAEFVPGMQFLDALQVLRVLWEARGSREAVNERRLHGILKLPIDRIDEILESMRVAGWVARGRRGFTLARDLSEISVADVYDLLVFRGDARLPARESGQALDGYALELAQGARHNLELPVEALFERTSPNAPESAGERL
jgi:membrane protein